MKHALRIALVGVALAVVFSGGTAAADSPRYSGTVTGVFDASALAGAFFDAASRLPVACDNTSGAGVVGVSTSSVTWGDDLGESKLTFVGDSFSDVTAGDVFPLGALVYLNGPNRPASLVFGFTMRIGAGDDVTPAAKPLAVVSTLNGNVDRVKDADVLVFGGFETPSTLAAFEGAAVTATVYGKIDATAALEVTSIELASGEAEHGFVAEGPFEDSAACTSACGDVSAAVESPLAAPLCAGEQLPSSLRGRIDRALEVLDPGTSTGSERETKKGLRVAMRQLRRSAALAGRVARKGQLSKECAGAVGEAVRSARSQAEPWVGAR